MGGGQDHKRFRKAALDAGAAAKKTGNPVPGLVIALDDEWVRNGLERGGRDARCGRDARSGRDARCEIATDFEWGVKRLCFCVLRGGPEIS